MHGVQYGERHVRLLRRAAHDARINWTKGDLEDSKGRRCALGILAHVVYGNADRGDMSDNGGMLDQLVTLVSSEVTVRQGRPLPGQNCSCGCGAGISMLDRREWIVDWNDHRAKGGSEVADVFLAAANRILAELAGGEPDDPAPVSPGMPPSAEGQRVSLAWLRALVSWTPAGPSFSKREKELVESHTN